MLFVCDNDRIFINLYLRFSSQLCFLYLDWLEVLKTKSIGVSVNIFGLVFLWTFFMLIAKWSMTTLLAMFIFMDREEVKTLLYFVNIEIDIYLMDWDAAKTLIYFCSRSDATAPLIETERRGCEMGNCSSPLLCRPHKVTFLIISHKVTFLIHSTRGLS